MDEDEKELWRMRGTLCAFVVATGLLGFITTILDWLARVLPAHEEGTWSI